MFLDAILINQLKIKAAIAFIVYYYRQHFANCCQGKNLNQAITDLNQLSIQNFARSILSFIYVTTLKVMQIRF